MEEKDYAEKMPNFRLMEDASKRWRNFFLSLNLDVVSKNSTPEELVCVWLRKWVGIIAMKMKERELIFVKRRFRRCRRPRIRLRKRPFSKWLRAVANLLFHLVQFVKCWRRFLELNSRRLYLSSEYERQNPCLVFTSSTGHENRQFHVLVVQRLQRRNMQKAWSTCKVAVMLI